MENTAPLPTTPQQQWPPCTRILQARTYRTEKNMGGFHCPRMDALHGSLSPVQVVKKTALLWMSQPQQ